MKLIEEEKYSLKKRTEKKADEILSYIEQLIRFKPETFEEYERNSEKKAACERMCEKISEGLVDLAIFLIRIKEIPYNDEDEKAFGVLLKHKIINESLCGKLRNLKGMRDHLAHRYGEINDKIVFNAIDNEIEKDAGEFIDAVNNALKEIK